MESYSLYQLNEYLKRVIALNFNDPIWIHAEILQVSESRGNHYIELIEKKTDGQEVIAQSSAVIWYKSFLFLKSKLKKTLPSLLQPGVEVRLKIKLDFHERYGLSLVIQDIDPSFTLGKLELQRQELISKLEIEELIDKNSLRQLPLICQKIAIISSKTAAGYQDFLKQLSDNSYGYFYKVELFDSAMQGQNTTKDVTNALMQIDKRSDEFDCIIIIRGGGSKLDLASFDTYEICKSIANASLPVLTGIGHEIDNGIADLVSHSNLKTPTAVADFFIERSLHFDSDLINTFQEIKEECLSIIELERTYLGSKNSELQFSSERIIQDQNLQLTHLDELLTNSLRHIFDAQQIELNRISEVLNLSDPKRILEKGYAIVKQGGVLISSKNQLNPKENISISFADGEIQINQ